MESLSDAGNELNMIVLDACRDNPFGWNRSGTRGLTVVTGAPSGSIVMYSTGANSVAEDGNGRNGLFTSHFLNNLKTSGLSVFDVFDRTMGDVIRATNGRQHPELSLRFSGAAYAYLGARPVQPSTSSPSPPVPVQPSAKEHFEKGKVFFDRNDDDTAILEFTEAIKLDPNFSDAFAYRARTYNGNQDYDRALADSNTAIRLNPKNAIAYFARGNAYDGKKDYDRAIADYTQAIRLDPNFTLAYFGRGYAYADKKDYDRATADFTQVIRLDPNNAGAYGLRGSIYVEFKKDYDRAIADFTHAIRIDPNNANAYNNRGIAYQAKGDTARADADFAKAKELGLR
jgi:tetratricopeptide (TPR) repeat protein